MTQEAEGSQQTKGADPRTGTCEADSCCSLVSWPLPVLFGRARVLGFPALSWRVPVLSFSFLVSGRRRRVPAPRWEGRRVILLFTFCWRAPTRVTAFPGIPFRTFSWCSSSPLLSSFSSSLCTLSCRLRVISTSARCNG